MDTEIKELQVLFYLLCLSSARCFGAASRKHALPSSATGIAIPKMASTV